MFAIVTDPIDPGALRELVLDPAAGGFCSFEGWVRNHHQGRAVHALEYEAYRSLAEKEGTRILEEAKERFGIHHAVCQHRVGALGIGELAVVVCVSSSHRDAAFDACRYIIDEVKFRVPIWKKEHFADGTSGWVRCDHCHEAGHRHGHHHHG
ncbi:molybdenum cofactor biosynthesis protein MoaE [Luteolibacter flavescens]|uniref:Molybdopterin synthase catalytic subunit n=1 Tax=Luteolibacter flavescens TaxID=1859460 RepID=A0ABT3FSK9_9BACT|nr:molybdenum cofactor biosynthesis protein MoaE [Luteolibacter flavescens]MCW1886573.1 molybdenum cofactor biosynthesis protein MoaE [Luteolibacter flavescens]